MPRLLRDPLGRRTHAPTARLLGAATALLAGVAAFGCSAPASDDGSQGSQAAVNGVDESTDPTYRCDGTYMDSLVQDQGLERQAFNLTLAPGAAALLRLSSPRTVYTATVTSSDGKERTAVSKASFAKIPALANVSASPQTYRVVVARDGEPTTPFRVQCTQVDPDGTTPSGLNDRQVCRVGAPCTYKASGGGLPPGVCIGAITPELSAPETGGAPVGFCMQQ
jgi:hypothetical protein